jgi:hypothetical protein
MHADAGGHSSHEAPNINSMFFDWAAANMLMQAPAALAAPEQKTPEAVSRRCSGLAHVAFTSDVSRHTSGVGAVSTGGTKCTTSAPGDISDLHSRLSQQLSFHKTFEEEAKRL